MSVPNITPRRLEALHELFALFGPDEMIELLAETKHHYLQYVLRDEGITHGAHIADRADALDSLMAFLRAYEQK